LPFFRELNAAERETLQRHVLQLPSARLHLEEGELKTLFDQVLAAEGIELRQVRVKYPRDSFFSKGERAAVFQPEFREDLRHWVETDRRVALRALDLVEAVLRDPFQGIGKPEPLKYLASGAWSRRLTQEHRLVYLVREDRIDFLQARYHY
jgi:toxin YoeB